MRRSFINVKRFQLKLLKDFVYFKRFYSPEYVSVMRQGLIYLRRFRWIGKFLVEEEFYLND